MKPCSVRSFNLKEFDASQPFSNEENLIHKHFNFLMQILDLLTSLTTNRVPIGKLQTQSCTLNKNKNAKNLQKHPILIKTLPS